MPDEPRSTRDEEDDRAEQPSEHPLRSGTASPEFLRRSGASTDEEDLKPGERRRGGQRVRARGGGEGGE